MGLNENNKGVLNVYQLLHGVIQVVSTTKTPVGIKCSTFGSSLYDNNHLATGNMNGLLVIYDLNRLDQIVFSQQAHLSCVNCIDGCGGLGVGYGAPEILTGGRDGCVRLWDPRVPEPVIALEPDQGMWPHFSPIH